VSKALSAAMLSFLAGLGLSRIGSGSLVAEPARMGVMAEDVTVMGSARETVPAPKVGYDSRPVIRGRMVYVDPKSRRKKGHASYR
jgi:hypothetical protein